MEQGRQGRTWPALASLTFFGVWLLWLWEEGAVGREAHGGSGLDVQSRAQDSFDRCHDTIPSPKTCGVGVAQVWSHSTAVLLAHQLLRVSSHEHSSTQGRSQHEFPDVSLSSLQPTLTSQESRHASMPLSLAPNLSLLRYDNFLELTKVQGDLGVMQHCLGHRAAINSVRQ